MKLTKTPPGDKKRRKKRRKRFAREKFSGEGRWRRRKKEKSRRKKSGEFTAGSRRRGKSAPAAVTPKYFNRKRRGKTAEEKLRRKEKKAPGRRSLFPDPKITTVSGPRRGDGGCFFFNGSGRGGKNRGSPRFTIEKLNYSRSAETVKVGKTPETSNPISREKLASILRSGSLESGRRRGVGFRKKNCEIFVSGGEGG
jgi:hypothetical protein